MPATSPPRPSGTLGSRLGLPKLLARLPLPRWSNPPPSPTAATTVTTFLGEGGKKKVYLAHDTLLDRDVAFALIKTEGLDETAARASRAKRRRWDGSATTRTSSPCSTSARRTGQPYLVCRAAWPAAMSRALIEKAPEHRLPIERRAADRRSRSARGWSSRTRKGIVHRDLKPGNVWLTDDGTRQDRRLRPGRRARPLAADAGRA